MLSIAKPMKIKVLLRQFSLFMFNLRYIFLFVFLLDRLIAGIREMPHYNYPEGFEGRGEGKQTKTTTTTTTTKNKTLWELSFRYAFYLVRVVRVADIRVAWLVYLACLHSHVLRAYYNIDAQFYSNFAFEMNVNTLKLF